MSPSGYWHGGTLHVGERLDRRALDPQKAYDMVSWELLRCCLVRTLYSYNGHPTSEGGSVLRADVAEGPPRVSEDGLAWTFHLRDGLHYAPPFDDMSIVSADIVRALEREADPDVAAGYSFYYSPIRGFDDFAAGRADSIAGLETPDDLTLVVRVNEPTGDLAYRFSLPATAPIPAGASDGHDADLGPFLVASGPYMIEGSEAMDFSLPPGSQEPASGWVAGRSLTLVRNPSWRADVDPLRPAYVDRIEFSMPRARDLLGAAWDRTVEETMRRILAGELDVSGLAPTPDQVTRLRQDPALRDRVMQVDGNGTFFIPLNLAVPPFDDVHVRKAVNLAIDKAAILAFRDSQSSYIPGDMATHIAPDSIEANLLAGYDPYGTLDHRPDLDAARAEMARSAYDIDGDGLCDASVCEGVRALTTNYDGDRFWQSVRRDLERLGISLDVERVDDREFFRSILDPRAQVPVRFSYWGWTADYPSGGTYLVPLFSGDAISVGGNFNESLVGAAPDQLRRWGYEVRHVPSVDERIDACMALIGGAQTECWTALDQYLMEEVVPWVPFQGQGSRRLISDRVAHASFDQWTQELALEQVALVPGSD